MVPAFTFLLTVLIVHDCYRRYLPQVGMVTIVMNDYPYLKYALIGILGLLVVTNKEG